MITNVELFQKAVDAGHNYKTVYGCYPAKIGIHWRKFRNFDRESIMFPEMPDRPASFFAIQDMPPEKVMITMHRVPFEPVFLNEPVPASAYDDVFLPDPHGTRKIISGFKLDLDARSIKARREHLCTKNA